MDIERRKSLIVVMKNLLAMVEEAPSSDTALILSFKVKETAEKFYNRLVAETVREVREKFGG